jgi:hypothetical protein
MKIVDILSAVWPSQIFSVSHAPGATAEEQYAGLDWVGPAPKPTLAEIQAQEATATAALAARPKATAKAVFADSSPDSQALAAASRGLALVTLEEINTLRQWLAAFKTEVAVATSLEDLKTRVATLPATGDRTARQLRAAIRNKIDAE